MWVLRATLSGAVGPILPCNVLCSSNLPASLPSSPEESSEKSPSLELLEPEFESRLCAPGLPAAPRTGEGLVCFYMALRSAGRDDAACNVVSRLLRTLVRALATTARCVCRPIALCAKASGVFITTGSLPPAPVLDSCGARTFYSESF